MCLYLEMHKAKTLECEGDAVGFLYPEKCLMEVVASDMTTHAIQTC